ncbi:hypothetical protein ACFE04_001224 [Oxalis oulophora]
MASSLTFSSPMNQDYFFEEPEFSFLDPFVDLHNMFSSEDQLLPYLSTDDLVEIFPPHEFDSYHYAKRLKSTTSQTNYNAFPHGITIPPPAQPPVIFQAPPTMSFSYGRSDNVKKTALSVQSIAARERRRKITGKTQELGKLIPGGAKMNTAEMFQAAYKYIKFLQAQVQVLESIPDEVKETVPELRNLLGSQKMQEKLYSEESCLVPKQFMQSQEGSDIDGSQTNPNLIFDEIDGFLQADMAWTD